MTNNEYREARRKLGVNQQQLSLLLGLTQPAVSRLEQGQRGVTHQQAAGMALLIWIKDQGLFDQLVADKL